MNRLSALLLIETSLLAFIAPTFAADSPSSAVFGDLRRAQLADGIDDQGFVTIGGIKQWISVRGRHKDAPILLFVHGGPGFTSIPSSYYFMSGWDEYFTIAQYDERGAGQTYGANDPAQIRPTMTVDRLLADAEEVAAYLRSRYHRNKILLVGHSWGSFLGVELAQRRPDWFYAYVGIGQVVDMQQSEALGYEATLAAARKAGNAQAISELESLAPFPDSEHPERNLENLQKERRWLAYFRGATWRGTEDQYGDIANFSPDVTPMDRVDRNKGLDFSLTALWGALGRVSFWNTTEFRCPIVLLAGRHDINVNAGLTAQWYGRIHAPAKKLVWFEDSAHLVYEEEQGKMLVTLVEDVLPLTRAGPRKN
jgi:pimeloyl-ACP methyl ester carboxylesterase